MTGIPPRSPWPIWLTTGAMYLRTHPLALVGLVAAGYATYVVLLAPSPLIPPRAVRAEIPALETGKDTFIKQQLDSQRSAEESKKQVEALRGEMKTMKLAQEKSEAERAVREAQQQEQVKTLLAQIEEQKKRASVSRPVSASSVKGSIPVTTPRTVPEPSGDAKGRSVKIETVYPEQRRGFAGVPPMANRADIPYLAPGCFAEGRVITGLNASTRTEGGPMHIALTKPFTCPFELHPGTNPLQTALGIQGCFAIGKAGADLAQSRVLVKTSLLSCVWPDHAAFEAPLEGFVTDIDGTVGIFGKVETHAGAHIAKAAALGIAQEAAGIVAIAKSQVILAIPGGGNGAQLGQGMQSTLQEVGRFYLDQARLLLPTIPVQSGHQVRVHIGETGVALEGFPTYEMLASGRR